MTHLTAMEVDVFPISKRVVRTLLIAPLLMAVACGAGGPSSHVRAASATYRNPVFARPFPDPDAIRAGGTYYAYGTTLDWETPHHKFPILSSTDLVHWRYLGDAIPHKLSWGSGDWWAPDVIVHGGTYYLFYTGLGTIALGGVHCVAVATANRPTGPFEHRAVIGCADAQGQGYIDPDPFIDDNGKAYLYMSVDNPHHSISVIPLAPDLIHAAGPRRELFTISQPWEHGARFSTVEGPFMVKHAGRYYLFYSANDWQHNYGMGYAAAASPLGPFTKYAQNPILHSSAQVTGPGGGSLIQGPHGDWWLLYHAWAAGETLSNGGDTRTLRIDPVTWHGDAVQVAGPTVGDEPAP